MNELIELMNCDTAYTRCRTGACARRALHPSHGQELNESPEGSEANGRQLSRSASHHWAAVVAASTGACTPTCVHQGDGESVTHCLRIYMYFSCAKLGSLPVRIRIGIAAVDYMCAHFFVGADTLFGRCRGREPCDVRQ